MKIKILSAATALALALTLQGCHDPKEVESNGDPRGLLSMTAKFIDDEKAENSFDAIIDYDNHTVRFRFPMYYPRESFDELQAEDIANMRVTASLSTNSTIEPSLTTIDFTRTNSITVKNPRGVKTQYTVTGEIVKLWDCDLLEMELADGTPAIIDEHNHVITLVATTDLEPQTAHVKISPHATITPDIVNEPFDFNTENATITVVAQNGVDSKEYSIVKGAPDKIPFGFREGSETLRWVKKWTEAGYTLKDQQTGFAVTDKYIVLNEVGNMQAVVLKASDGSDTGRRLDMSIIPNGENYNMTSDHAGNIIVNSMFANGSFKVWVFKDIDDKGTLLLNQSVWGAGARVSVYGDVTRDGAIVTTLNGSKLQLCRWYIKDGVLGNAQIVSLAGVDDTPWTNADVALTSATDANADIYAVFYATIGGRRGPAQYSGSGTLRAIGLPSTKKRDESDGGQADAGNWVPNACDYVEFNKGKYFLHNSVNTFPWGDNDRIYLVDVSGGDITNEVLKSTAIDGALKFVVDQSASPTGIYGAMAAGGTGVAGNANDVRLWVSNTGFYMYAYFLFTNGYIGCVRVDCIQK